MIISFLALALFLFFYFTSKDKKESKQETIQVNNEQSNQGLKETIINNKPKSNIMLNFGIILIILSSVIFATISWNIMSNNIKVLFLFIETSIFLVSGIFLKNKVPKTSDALTFIGTALIGVSFLGIGYFKLFGMDFSLFGKYGNFFVSLSLLILSLALLLRNKLLKKTGYFIILASGFISLYYFINGIFNNFIISLSLLSVFLALINIFKKVLFKEKQEPFLIFNIISMIILSFCYLISFIYLIVSKQSILIYKVPFLVNIIFLSLNLYLTINKNNSIKFLALCYETMLLSIFICFTNSNFISSLVLLLSSIIIYFIYYLSNDKSFKLVSFIIYFIQTLSTIILGLFNKELLIIMLFVSLLNIFLSYLNTNKNDYSLRIINGLSKIIFIILFVISLVVNLRNIITFTFDNIMVIINSSLVILFIINTLFRKNIRNIYLIILMISIFIQTFTLSSSSIIYFIINVIINIILLGYTFFIKDNFNKKVNVPLSLLLIYNFINVPNKYSVIASIILFIFLLILIYLNKENKTKYLYLALCYIPIAMNDLYININISIISFIISFIIFIRLFINMQDKKASSIIELIILSFCLFRFNKNIFIIITLLGLLVYAIFIRKKDFISPKIYFNYVIYSSLFFAFKFAGSLNAGLYMLSLLSIVIASQIIYNSLIGIRTGKQEGVNSVITFLLLIITVGALNFNIFGSLIISVFILIIMNFSYNNIKVKYLILAYFVYPLVSIFDEIPNDTISSILMTFSFIFPLYIFTRKIFNSDEKTSNTIEIIILSIMFLTYIFNTNLYTAISLGIISLIFILLSYIFKYKSMKLIGYISFALTIIIQTFNLWKDLPWWFYLLIVGILFVVISALKENNKKID